MIGISNNQSSQQATIEVVGPWLLNQGDVLNLWTVHHRLAPAMKLGATSNLGLNDLPPDPPLLRIRSRLDRQAAGRAVRSRDVKDLTRFLLDTSVLLLAPSGKHAEARQLARLRDVSGLVDCSGFAYGDCWGNSRVERRISHYRRIRQQGARIVMLPQAYGPFRDPAKRSSCATLFNLCDLIYARDEISLQHLRGLSLDAPVLGPIPDITHALAGSPPSDRSNWERRVCIVPNTRMIDRTSREEAGKYETLLTAVFDSVMKRGLEPVILVHEANDRALAEKLAKRVKPAVQIYQETALRAKGIIGASYALIGSRYHALVSSLSQAVPALATSWSHKYEELFKDYACSKNILNLQTPQSQLIQQVDEFLDTASICRLRPVLSRHASEQTAKVEVMWSQVLRMFA